MIVLDASVVVELLTNGLLADSIRHDLAGRDDVFLVPHLLDIEVLSAIRGLERSGNLDEVRAEEALADYSDLPIVRASCDADQRHRIWSLRHNLTAYDAAYVALAARLDRPVWTRDAKVLAAAGRSARVVLV